VADITAVDAHVGGQLIRLVTGGVRPIRGRTMVEKLAFARVRFEQLRRRVMFEPRGHRDVRGVMLTDTATANADAGLLFMSPGGWPLICGHGIVAAVTIALERDLLGARRNDNDFSIDTPGGVIPVRASLERATPVARGVSESAVRRVSSLTFTTPPVQLLAGGVKVRAGGRVLPADIAEVSGALQAIVDAEGAGLGLTRSAIPSLRQRAADVLAGAEAAIAGTTGGDSRRLECVIFTAPAHGSADLRVVSVHADGSVGRSPSGLDAAAVLVVLHTMGLVTGDAELLFEGITETTIGARVSAHTESNGVPALSVDVTATAWIIAEHTFVVASRDPLRDGFET
jgi:proline racemase